jgi:hypothetical protein
MHAFRTNQLFYYASLFSILELPNSVQAGPVKFIFKTKNKDLLILSVQH